MKKLYFLLIFSLFINIHLLSQTADITDGCYPLTVNFSSNENISKWDFGNGSVSELKNPSHIYTKAGSYEVKLNGNKVLTINVFEKPEVVLTATPSKGCTPLFVTYNLSTKSNLPSDFSFDLNNINWNFQDGNSTKNTLNTTYFYNKTGQFDIGTSVNFLYKNKPVSSCGSSPLFEKIVTTSTIIPSFLTTPSTASSCTVPFDISFKNNSTSSGDVTYNWDFGNNKTSTVKDGEPQRYDKEGQFIVKLTIKDSICTKEVTKTISIGKPKSDFSVPNNNDTICANIYTTFKNKSTNGNYKWIFDNTSSPTQSTDFEPNVKFSLPGKHTVKLITIANGCSDTMSKTIFVEDSILQILSIPGYSCQDTVTVSYSTKPNPNLGKISSYLWTFPFNGKPTSTSSSNPKCFYNTYDSTYHYRKLNLHEVTLTAVTKAGCYLKKDTKIDTIQEVWARFVPDKTDGCLPLKINFSDSSMTHPKDPNKKLDSWYWDFGDGSNSNSPGSQSHTYLTPGIYYSKLIVKDIQTNCIDTSYSVEIRVGETQNITFDVSPTTICPGEEITLSNTSDLSVIKNISSWHYSSDKELISHCSDIDNLKTTLNDTIGNHTIKLTGEYNGCYSTSQISKNVLVNGPIASFDYLQDCKSPSIIKLVNKAQGANKIEWVINNTIVNASSLDTTTIDLSLLTPAIITGDVKIKMIATGLSCPSDSDSTFIHYGTVKSVFQIEDDKNKTLTPISPSTKINVGDASTGSKYVFNASNSIDINPKDCYRGYSFLQESDRPNTYNNPKDTFLLNKKSNNNTPEDQIVKMVVRNANNCVDTSELKVRIFNLNPSFEVFIKDNITNSPKVVTSVCLPSTLYFNEKSLADTTIKDWFWQFSDGSIYNGKTPPNHLFTNSTGNNISITLTITDANGFKKSKTETLLIYKPTAKITADKSINPITNTLKICENEKVKFTSNTIIGDALVNNWTFVNSSINKTGNIIDSDPWKVNSGMSEMDTVILKITEPSTGCKNDTLVYVYIEKYPNTTLITDIKNNTACASESSSGTKSYNSNFSTDLNKNPIGTTSLWDLGYNNSISTNDKPSLSYPIGNYTVKLTLTTPNQCKKDSTFTFKVIEKPTGSFTAGPLTICKSESVTFEITQKSAEATTFKWDFDDGNIDSTKTKITHQYNILPPSGKVTAKLIVINGVCPSNPITKDIFIKYVKADFNTFDISQGEIDDTICYGDSYNFINTSVSSNQYKWIYGNNQTSTNKDINNFTFNSTGEKKISLLVSNNENACKDTLTKTIFVKPLPAPEGVEQIICYGKGQSIKLETKDTLPNTIYTWNKTELNPIKTETYVVTAKDTIDNCVNSDDVLMVVIQPINHIDWDTTIVIGDAVKLPINNQYNTVLFDWNPTVGLSCTNCSYPTIRPLADTIYTVVMKDKLNCFSETGIFKITVKPDTHIKLPTTFTPNGDGNNDILYVRGWGIKELVTFEIYNRWGALLFQTNDINTGWDGYYKNEIQNSEVYVYKVIAKSWLNREITEQGYVHLMR